MTVCTCRFNVRDVLIRTKHRSRHQATALPLLQRWMMATGVRTNAGFGVGAATRLFDTRSLSLSGIGRNFDVSPDGSRFLMTKDLQPPADAKRLIVVQNWTEELKRLVPAR